MTYFYTAIFNQKTREIQFAEHFEDELEMRKRSSQLETEARSRGEDDPWLCYRGDEPIEAYFARIDAKQEDGEKPDPEDTVEQNTEKTQKFIDRVNILAAKAGSKTISVLTPAEVDDSQEARNLPDWAIAQHAMEAAIQAVVDAKQGADALQLRADNLAEEAYSREAASMTEGLKQEARKKALSAQSDADYEKARLYHAEQDLIAKKAEFDRLFAIFQEQSKAQGGPKK